MTDLEFENKTFYEWMEDLKRNKNTWFAYFLRGGNSTYVGLLSGDQKFTFKFENMDFKETRQRLKFNNLRTNLDEHLTVFDNNLLQDCRKLAENRWHKDCGLGYQVKEQGR